MELSFDSKHNITYLRLRDKPEIGVEALRISDEVTIDIGSDGRFYGIEFMNANEQIAAEKHPLFRFINERRNERSELPLTL